MRKYLDIPLTLIISFFITIAMLWPIKHQPLGLDGLDKLAHFIAFASLAFPLARTGRFGLVPVFIGATAFGGVIELLQPTLERSADIQDWLVDAVGVLSGIALALIYRKVRERRV